MPIQLRGLATTVLMAFGLNAFVAQASPLRLAVNPWPASALNVEVAAQLLRTELGREVAVAAVDENAQWDLLAKGEVEAVLEMWPSGHMAAWQKHVVERRDVVPGGSLGVRGQIGWFTTRATVKKYPKLATWAGLSRKDQARVFAGEDDERGRLLTGDPSWTQFDREIIRNLGLPLDVVSLGSEAALVAEVRRAAKAGEPVLFYFYTPHALFKELDLVMVELPKHNSDQWSKAGMGGAACAYPEENLTKLFSKRLVESDAEATAFLRAMRYNNEAHLEMLAGLAKGRSASEAAAAWIAAHPDAWRPWIAAARAVKRPAAEAADRVAAP